MKRITIAIFVTLVGTVLTRESGSEFQSAALLAIKL